MAVPYEYDSTMPMAAAAAAAAANIPPLFQARANSLDGFSGLNVFTTTFDPFNSLQHLSPTPLPSPGWNTGDDRADFSLADTRQQQVHSPPPPPQQLLQQPTPQQLLQQPPPPQQKPQRRRRQRQPQPQQQQQPQQPEGHAIYTEEELSRYRAFNHEHGLQPAALRSPVLGSAPESHDNSTRGFLTNASLVLPAPAPMPMQQQQQPQQVQQHQPLPQRRFSLSEFDIITNAATSDGTTRVREHVRADGGIGDDNYDDEDDDDNDDDGDEAGCVASAAGAATAATAATCARPDVRPRRGRLQIATALDMVSDETSLAMQRRDEALRAVREKYAPNDRARLNAERTIRNAFARDRCTNAMNFFNLVVPRCRAIVPLVDERVQQLWMAHSATSGSGDDAALVSAAAATAAIDSDARAAELSARKPITMAFASIVESANVAAREAQFEVRIAELKSRVAHECAARTACERDLELARTALMAVTRSAEDVRSAQEHTARESRAAFEASLVARDTAARANFASEVACFEAKRVHLDDMVQSVVAVRANAQFEATLATRENELAVERARVATLEAEVVTRTDAFNWAHKRIAELEAGNETTSHELSLSMKCVDEITADAKVTAQQLAAAQQRVSELEAAVAAAAAAAVTHADELSETKKHANELEAAAAAAAVTHANELSETKKHANELATKFETAAATHADELAAAQKRVNELETAAATHADELSAAQKRVNELEATDTATAQQLAAAQKRANELDAELVNLRASYETQFNDVVAECNAQGQKIFDEEFKLINDKYKQTVDELRATHKQEIDALRAAHEAAAAAASSSRIETLKSLADQFMTSAAKLCN